MRYITIILLLVSLRAFSQEEVIVVGSSTPTDDDYTQSEIQNFAATVIHDTAEVFRDSTSIDVLRVGGKNAYVTVDSVKGVFFTGDATVWNDLTFPATQLKAVGQNDKPDFIAANVALSFPEDTTEMVGIIVQMPHTWKSGSTIYPHVHWRQTEDQNVDWRISYKWWNIGDLEPTNYTQVLLTTRTQTYQAGTQHQLSTNTSGISGVGKTISSILVIKLYRKADNATGEVQLLQFDIHYEINKWGSRSESSE